MQKWYRCGVSTLYAIYRLSSDGERGGTTLIGEGVRINKDLAKPMDG